MPASARSSARLMAWLPLRSRLFVYSMPTRLAEVADLETFDREIVVFANEHHVSEVALQAVDHGPVAARIGAAGLEERDAYALGRQS